MSGRGCGDVGGGVGQGRVRWVMMRPWVSVGVRVSVMAVGSGEPLSVSVGAVPPDGHCQGGGGSLGGLMWESGEVWEGRVGVGGGTEAGGGVSGGRLLRLRQRLRRGERVRVQSPGACG